MSRKRLPIRALKYEEYIDKVKRLCIRIDTKTNVAYVIPDFKHVLYQEDMRPEKCEFEITIEDIYEILTLEVEGWNKCNSNINKFLNTIAEYLTDEFINEKIAEAFREAREKLDSKKAKEEINEKYGVPQVDYTLRK